MDKNLIKPENRENESGKPIETDSEKIVRRHLEDEDDEISDADIRNVRIVGEEDEPTTVAANVAVENKEKLEDEEGAGDEDNELPNPNEKPVTPWDVIS